MSPQVVGLIGAGRSAVAAETAQPGHYALAMSLGGGPIGTTVRLVPSIDPTVDYTPMPSGVDLTPNGYLAASLVETNDGGLLSVALRVSNPWRLTLERLQNDEVTVAQPASGCSTNQFAARVLALDERVLLATTSARPPDSCVPNGEPLGPATRLQVGFLDGVNFTVQHDEAEAGEPVIFLEMVGGGERAWVLWTSDGSTSLVPPPIFAALLDAHGNFVGPRVAAIPPEEHAAVGVAAFGDGFVTASLDNVDPSTPTLVLRLFNQVGTLATTFSYPMPDFVMGRRLALQVSPEQDALLIGWTAPGELGLPDSVTVMMRLDCVAGR